MATATTATSLPTPDVKQRYGFGQSFKHWWNRSNLEEAEREVLSLLPFYPTCRDNRRKAETMDVAIDAHNKIHEFNIQNLEETVDQKQHHIVLIHGYGAALGFFYKNFEDLTEKPGSNLHALDLLGYGLSSRPDFPPFKGNSKDDVLKVEDFFIESVEAWRKKRNIDKFYLIGHSLGGYLSSLYALKYPEHVYKLVLISPVGVETSVYDLSGSSFTNSSTSDIIEDPDIEREVGAHNRDTDSSTGQGMKTSSSFHVPDVNGYVKRLPNFPSYLKFLWEKNLSPFSFVRCMGPWGPSLTSRWSFKRFGKTEDYEKTMKLHIYSYNTFVARGSGEYALTRLLAPGALARYPLLVRVPKQLKVDSLWLYGDDDWMSKEAGLTMVEQINKENSSIISGVTADYGIISRAGHHIYLDNPEEFRDSVYKFFDW